ncbi:MAG: diaminopropionate ammonia-lyase, partial [Calditrichaceae bacterium]
NFHHQIPEYRITPLKSLPHLALMQNLGGIWVKDESQRLNLNSIKVLGGSFAIYRFLKTRLNLDHTEMTLAELTSEKIRKKLGKITIAAATDGNHGMGIAWSARQLGYDSIIYVHKHTTAPRIKAIERNGAKVVIIDGTYDDAVRRVTRDALKNDWQVISDTSWDGYEDIPKWVMQGYTTMFSETQEQFAAQGINKPTHIFMQAGVGALAASTIGYYRQIFGADSPKFVVVEPTNAACLYQSAKIFDGEPHSFDGKLNTMMAGLACGDPSPLAWKILKDFADVFVTCPDYVAAKGMRVYGVPLNGDPFIVSGESGAVTLGALMFMMSLPEYLPLRKHLDLGPDSRILLLNTEGNTDPDDFRQVVWEGSNPVPKPFRMAKRL